jgi:prepilin-type N-terminal cleavage/methylation domain-containing protein
MNKGIDFMIRTQRGITLIELLVTLTILSLFGVIIWSVFFQGYKFSQNSISKNTLQQEANILITSLKKTHQTSKEYVINSSSCQVTVNVTKQDNSTQNYVFKNKDLCISLSQNGLIEPKDKDSSLEINIKIYEINNPNNNFEINTILYRLKDGGI